jgi:hypothetical protein
VTIYLVYSKNRKGRVTLLGPVFIIQEQAEAEVERQREQGWDASWVGLNEQARYICA